ncbi:hypothetical protein P8844_06150 [Bacillus spizizenii]|nr:hypothetical protein [Bacillus spizizenii]MCY8052195.1 hypothetical protein [Bacillus spizizenii]MCY8646959.1 hypothetical protein [Bacillus spizizenii]MEC0732159.1 hypothetical protein [Bacillus spizizenii]
MLSELNILSGSNVNERLKNLNAHFYEIFMEKDARPTFNDKFIFFDMNKHYKGITLPFPERFMHICSIEDKNYSMFPCNNDFTFALCSNKCQMSSALSSFKKINRTECLYRMARIHWIPEIIILANGNDENIYKWIKEKTLKKGKKEKIQFIRYKDEKTDYVILLEIVERKKEIINYKFKTAYPVFLKNNILEFNADYEKYQKKTKEKSAQKSTLLSE